MFEDGKPVCLWSTLLPTCFLKNSFSAHNTVVTDKAPYKKWGLTEFTVLSRQYNETYLSGQLVQINR